MSEEIAIKVDSVSKNFVLPHEKVNSVKGLFTSATKRKTKKSSEIQYALKNISFEVKKGEFFGIVGRNGSGKSTLLKILAGIYQPSSGNVQTHGKLVPFIELGVGFNPELTGRENVYLNGALMGFSKKQIDELYDDIISFAELERFMDQKLKNYSSGMQIRLAFSMATRADADILVVDEVLAVGDADFQRKCFEYFKHLKKSNTTVIFVSHDMDAVREYCDRAMLIEKSEVIDVGVTNQVAEKYLQLFMTDISSARDQGKDSEAKRWGDGLVQIQDVKVKFVENKIHLTKTYHTKLGADRPILGFRIKDATGRDITGTNTKIEQVDVGTLSPNKSGKVEWTFPNLLSDGSYSVDAAILHSDGVTVYDWWDDALNFNVKKLKHLPYPIDPGITTKIE